MYLSRFRSISPICRCPLGIQAAFIHTTTNKQQNVHRTNIHSYSNRTKVQHYSTRFWRTISLKTNSPVTERSTFDAREWLQSYYARRLSNKLSNPVANHCNKFHSSSPRHIQNLITLIRCLHSVSEQHSGHWTPAKFRIIIRLHVNILVAKATQSHLIVVITKQTAWLLKIAAIDRKKACSLSVVVYVSPITSAARFHPYISIP